MTTRTPEEIAGETIAELQAIEGVAWDEDTIARATVVAVWAVRGAVAAETEDHRALIREIVIAVEWTDAQSKVYRIIEDFNRAHAAAIRAKEPTR